MVFARRPPVKYFAPARVITLPAKLSHYTEALRPRGRQQRALIYAEVTLRHCHDPFNRSESNLSAISIRSFVASRSIPLDVTGHPSSIAWIEVAGSNLNGAKWNYAVNFRPRKNSPWTERYIGREIEAWTKCFEIFSKIYFLEKRNREREIKITRIFLFWSIRIMNGKSYHRKCRKYTWKYFELFLSFEKNLFFETYRSWNEIGIVKSNYMFFSANRNFLFPFFFFVNRNIYHRWRNWNVENIPKRSEYFFENFENYFLGR